VKAEDKEMRVANAVFLLIIQKGRELLHQE
jgi:hypothetical protein